MRPYVVQRLLLFPVMLIVVSIGVFGMLRILPGDVADVILSQGGQSTYTPAEYEALRASLGLNQPLALQYGSWLSGLLHLDLGRSLFYNTPVWDQLHPRFLVTLELTLIAWTLAVIAGVISGILMAVHRDSWPDYLLRMVSISGLTTPAYWTGSLIVLMLVTVFNWLPPVGATPLWQDPWKNLQQVIFPALAAAYSQTGLVARMTRSSMLEVLRQDYMRTALAKGLPNRLAIRRHALKNAAIPVVTVAGYQFGTLMSGVMVLELLFNLPGLGQGFFQAIQVRDYPFIQALVTLTAFVFLASNLIVDLLYAWLDPRIRYR